MPSDRVRPSVGQPIAEGAHCGGFFGRDFYGPARVEAVGYDWIVVRDDDGQAWCAVGRRVEEIPLDA